MANDHAETIILDIHIEAERLLDVYRGRVQSVFACSRDGRRVRLPIQPLRGFVTRAGVDGTFAVTIDSKHRLLGIERLA